MNSSGTKITKTSKLPQQPPNKPSTMVIVAVVIAVLAGAGYYFINQSDKVETSPALKNPVNVQETKQAVVATKKLKYLIREMKGIEIGAEIRRDAFETYYRKRGLNVAIDFLAHDEIYDDKKNGDWDILLDSTYTGLNLLAAGAKIEALISSKGCSLDSHLLVMKDSSYFIDNIAEAKTIVIFNNGKFSPGQYSLISTLKLNPENIYYSQKREDVIAGLRSGKIDVLIEDTYLSDDGKLGDASGRGFFSQYNQLATTNFAIPCKTLLMKEGTNKEEIDKFLEASKNMLKIFGTNERMKPKEFEEYAKKFDMAKSAELEKSLKLYIPN